MRELEDFLLMVGDFAKGHASLLFFHPLPKFHEENEYRGPAVVRLVEVQDDILDAGAVQKVKNFPLPRLDPLVIQFSKVHGWDDDDCVAFLLDLKDSVCGCKFFLRHAT